MRRFESGEAADPRHEVRECGRCLEGFVYKSSLLTGRWVPCGACEGAGKRSVYVYPKKGRRS